MEIPVDTLNLVSSHVSTLFKTYPRTHLVYHNFSHTEQVVKYCGEISSGYSITDSDRMVLQIAAWFHDTGHLFSKAKGHEAVSIKVMRRFMESIPVETQMLDKIARCIQATEISAQPYNLLEQIICDADTYHFGTNDFWMTDEWVKREMVSGEGISLKDWDTKTLLMLKKHHFHTSYCQQKLNQGKIKNIDILQKKIYYQQ